MLDPSTRPHISFEFLIPHHPPPSMCVVEFRAGGPRSAEVPFLTLFEPPSFGSARCFGQTMSRVAPHGKRAEVRVTSKSETTNRSDGGQKFRIADGLRPSRRTVTSGWPMAGLLPPFLSGSWPHPAPDGGFRSPNSEFTHRRGIELRSAVLSLRPNAFLCYNTGCCFRLESGPEAHFFFCSGESYEAG